MGKETSRLTDTQLPRNRHAWRVAKQRLHPDIMISESVSALFTRVKRRIIYQREKHIPGKGIS